MVDFKQKNKRFILKSRDRIISILKKHKSMFITELQKKSHVQYNELILFLEDLERQGKIIIITTKVRDINDKIITGGTEIIWKQQKKSLKD